jgi:hypothetical protein
MINKADALTSLCPGATWNWVGTDYSGLEWLDETQPKPTEEAIDAEQARLEAQVPFNNCKAQAVALLQATDWTTIPDVANPSASSPYLMNQGAFIAWRSQVRALAVNPIANPIFPTQPTEQWSS